MNEILATVTYKEIFLRAKAHPSAGINGGMIITPGRPPVGTVNQFHHCALAKRSALKRLCRITAIAVGIMSFCGCQKPPPPDSPQILSVWIWEDFLCPKLIGDFERRTGCSLDIHYYDSNEELLAKLRTAEVLPDVIVPSSHYLARLDHEGYLGKPDQRLLPHLKHIDPTVGGCFDTGFAQQYGIPYLVAPTGIGIHGSAPANLTWDQLGKTKDATLLRDMRELFAIALIALGESPNASDTVALDSAADRIREWMAAGAELNSGDYDDRLRTGEIRASHAWASDVVGSTEREHPIRFILPGEGFVVTCDFLCVTSLAVNHELAHEFLDFLCEPEVAKENMSWIGVRAPNPDSVRLLPGKVKALPGFKFMDRRRSRGATLLEALPPQAEAHCRKLWDEILNLKQ